MLIPRELFEAHRFASTDESRYQLNGVYFTRDKETRQPELCATDGKFLVHAQWREDDWREMPDVDAHPVPSENGFGAIVRNDTCKRVLKSAPKKPPKPILGNVVLEENDDDATKLSATDLESKMALVEEKIAGTFPNYHSAINREYPEAYTLRANPVRLTAALDALIRMTGKSRRELANATVEIALAQERGEEGKPAKGLPVRIRHHADGRTIDAYIMPLVIE